MTSTGNVATRVWPSAAVAGDLGADDQILNDEVLIPLEGCLGGHVGQRDDDLVGDDQLRGLGSFSGPRSFLAGYGWRSGRSFEAAGCDHGTRFQALEAGDLVFELLDAFLLEADDLEQLSHERREIGFRDVGKKERHGQILPTAKPLRPGFLRSYPGLT